jgi:ribonuclease HI
MSKKYFYAVRRGHEPGIFSNWPDTQRSVSGFSGAEHKKFTTQEEAERWIDVKRTNDTATELSSQPTPKKQKTSTTTTNCTIVYCDGSCLNNGKPGARAGAGVYFGPGDERNLSEGLAAEQHPHTNQKAELWAGIRALQLCSSVSPLKLYSDSQYTISSATRWRRSWIASGWKTKLSNMKLHRQLSDLMDERETQHLQTEWCYVAGHSNVRGNDEADALAKSAARSVKPVHM